MKYLLLSFLGLSILSSGCIGDDIIMDEVDETLSIINPLDTLGEGQTYQLETRYSNNVGVVEEATVLWSSSVPEIIEVNENGLLSGMARGMATITATVELPDEMLTASSTIVVGEETVEPPPPPPSLTRNGTIATTSSYALSGEFEIHETDTGIRIDIAEDYEASTALPGLYVYLGNNPNSIGNAYEIQAVQVFNGAHSYEIDGIGINDYDYILYWCKPFGVKVGDGKIE